MTWLIIMFVNVEYWNSHGIVQFQKCIKEFNFIWELIKIMHM